MSKHAFWRLAFRRLLAQTKAWRDLGACGACLASDLDPCAVLNYPGWCLGAPVRGCG